MAGFKNLRELTDAQDAGNYLYASWRKQPTQTTGAGIWFDLSMSPGNPAPNYYIGAPNAFVPLKQSTDGGLRHGGNVNALGKKKFLRKLMAMTPTATAAPLSCKLLDYVGFYGFIDESVLDQQFMDNSVSPTRYVNNAVTKLGEELLVGGDLGSSVGWTEGAAAISGGVASINAAGNQAIAKFVPVINGRRYKVTYEVLESNGAQLFTSGGGFGGVSKSTPATVGYRETVVTCQNQSVAFRLALAAGSCTLDNISVKEILNPGTQPSLQLMPIVVAGQTGGQPFYVKYTNQDGVADRTTLLATMTSQFVNGTVLHSSYTGSSNGPFLPLQEGDSGVRSVQSVTIGGVGDVGLFALVLVKPLASFSLYGIDAPTETDYFTDAASMPEILDDAYLNFVVLPNGSLSGAPIMGLVETVFN
jgi:hypothetical protein